MSGWADEKHVEMLKKLWADGLTASQISKRLSREFPSASYTRNAVIGKATRLGLAGRGKPSKPETIKRISVARREGAAAVQSARERAAKAEPKPPPSLKSKSENTLAHRIAQKAAKPQLIITGGHVAEKPPGHEPLAAISKRAWEPLPGSNPKPWTERRFGECNWPIGEGLSCCEPVHKRGWCTAHFERGTQPMASSKPRSSNELMRSLRRYVA